MKIDETEYISVRKTWDPPKRTEPKKVKERESENHPACKKLRKEAERLTNILQIEGKVVEGEPVNMENYEVCTVDWEKSLHIKKKCWI